MAKRRVELDQWVNSDEQTWVSSCERQGLSRKGENLDAPPQFRRTPQLDVGDNVRDIVLTLAENGGGQLKLRHKTPNGRITEVEINVPGDAH